MDWKQEQKRLQNKHRPTVDKNMKEYDKIRGIRVGDYVKRNGKYYRISYIWHDENDKPIQYQIATGGSFYLGEGYVSFSGGLDTGFDEKTKFKNAGYKKNGRVWIFKNNFMTADNSVEYDDVKFRVYYASKNPKL